MMSFLFGARIRLQPKTHKHVIEPQLSVRRLADFMAGTETARRTIIRDCKYPPIARVIHHKEARMAISRHIWSATKDDAALKAKSAELRTRLADTDFERDMLDHNADYIDRFVAIKQLLGLPKGEVYAPGAPLKMSLHKVQVTGELHFRLRRITKTNKTRIGAGMLRYARGKALALPVAQWQSSIIFGMLSVMTVEHEAQPEHKLCVTIDAYSGECHVSPTDAVSRCNNTQAACASIAERWPNVSPPKGAVL